MEKKITLLNYYSSNSSSTHQTDDSRTEFLLIVHKLRITIDNFSHEIRDEIRMVYLLVRLWKQLHDAAVANENLKMWLHCRVIEAIVQGLPIVQFFCLSASNWLTCISRFVTYWKCLPNCCMLHFVNFSMTSNVAQIHSAFDSTLIPLSMSTAYDHVNNLHWLNYLQEMYLNYIQELTNNSQLL